jgi:hypothetical protein
MTPYSIAEVDQRFRGTYRLHLQDQRVSQASNQQEASEVYRLFYTA